MRDYKNVRVPKKYRTQSNRVTVKRLELNRTTVRPYMNAKRVQNIALTTFVIMVIIAGSWIGWHVYREVMHAELFQISGVDVRGANQLDDANLKKIVGVFVNENIFRADLDAAVKRAQANPWVKAVSIYRRLPNRISMTVTEREPFALLDTGSGYFLIDNEGVIIEWLIKEKMGAWPLPVIIIKNYRARPGEQVTSETLEEALKLLSEIAKRGGWRLNDVMLKANTPESLSIVYANHEFKLGSGHYAEKLRRLAEVMADVKRRNLNIAYVDLRPERQVAVLVKNDNIQGSRQGIRKKTQK
ncbi:MAG TPA: FtsQ-type POTRA domain-containing protein [Nitrospirota bacterium]|nr:FtsQ-type POTRA domain-containing protein [Nitrospirota bacterium]